MERDQPSSKGQLDYEAQVRVGLMGLGRWGKRLARVLHEKGVLVSCSNRANEEDRNWARRELTGTSVVEPAELIADPSLDAVVIATPINTHYDLAKQVLNSAKHLLVEKPLATTRFESDEVIHLAGENHCQILVGYSFLFHDILRDIRSITLNDPVRSSDFRWWKLGSFEETIEVNLLPHELALMHAIHGELPTELVRTSTRAHGDRVDALSLHATFRNSEATLEIDRCKPTRLKTISMETTGGRTLVWEDNSLFEFDTDRGMQRIARAQSSALENEIDAFIALVGGASRPTQVPDSEIVGLIEALSGPQRLHNH